MELSKNYLPAAAEEKWYQHWMDKGYFRSQPDDRQPFTVVIPPPNVTGVLHMGHTLNETVQDILVRHARMSGFNACWVPGSDHASIATEAKVVDMLKREKGIDKSQLTRESFLQYAYEWKDKYGGIIYSQIKKLGCSCDWDRVTFTMDDHYYKAVIKVFIDLYQKGLIYRGARMINWDPAAKTALSDEEVEYREVEGRLFHVKYQLEGSDEFITIATGRPETIMGDSAICVNPTDERYTHLKGRYALVPLINRRIPIIFDEYVDKAFGTGCLKVTPAHDINDYNLGLKHNLEIIDTLNDDGTLSPAAQIYVGLDRFVARKKIVEELKEKGLLVKEETYPSKTGMSQRTNAVVEPRISTQWFVKMAEMAKPALEAVISGEVRIHPGDRFMATYKYWMENVKDWCISRQLWWGQQIPAYYAPDGTFEVASSAEEALAQFQAKNPSFAFTTADLVQDEDCLDTWFSSWLWPVQVFKGITEPDNADINYYYPTSVLVTGQDIIFFWVARMIMAGLEYKEVKPFSDVYFTGMVRDKQGRKMSKSLGNSPDLLELIKQFGADAVRFGIMISSPAGNDLLFDDSSCEQGRNFANKIWNALKLVKMWEGRCEGDANASVKDNFAVQWFANRLAEAKASVEGLYKDFRLSEALKTIYSLVWDDFCSWYLEWIKPGFEQPIDAAVHAQTIRFFEELMQLLHPFMPFVTEDIYHHLAERTAGDDLIIKQFATAPATDAALLASGDLAKEVITAIRDARNKHTIKPKDTIVLHIETSNEAAFAPIKSILAKQVNATDIHFANASVPGSIALVIQKDKFYLETEQAMDPAAQKEQLEKDLVYLQGFLASVDKKLSNERFVQNAKPEIIALERQKKEDAQAKIKAIEESLKAL
ncbi:valine--tRNA ligase [Chitinophaga parva]|uniref:Valine--tRNA ligase n=1 Tax=Chitinophaga parva TaxID=2169414 RepID=A0A2T7BBF8_9BACT|nr:valine--tRNA ligase [Chitinophaga parva]PUZ21721.1 valine--tRNA ligase [Chitinophaga parva]